MFHLLARNRGFPHVLERAVTPTIDAIAFAVSKPGPAHANLGCPFP